MKTGYNEYPPLETQEQTEDQDVPLTTFGGSGGPRINLIQKLRELELPDQYLRTCTLREGTILTMILFQTMSLFVVVFLSVMLIKFPQQTSDWWKEKFRNDLDYYYMDENQDIINKLFPLWEDIAKAVIAVHFIFFLSGWLVVIALMWRNIHPFLYLPWIALSCILSTLHWLIIATQVICIIIFLFFRELSVTWDLVPITLSIVYGVVWTYSCAVVIAQYKRRTVVRYWRNRQHVMENFPPEINEYLYQYCGKAR